MVIEKGNKPDVSDGTAEVGFLGPSAVFTLLSRSIALNTTSKATGRVGCEDDDDDDDEDKDAEGAETEEAKEEEE